MAHISNAAINLVSLREFARKELVDILNQVKVRASASAGASASARRSQPEAESEPVSEPETVPRSGAPLAWAQVAAVSAAAPPIEDYDIPEPKKGDWIEHRQFGLCRIDGEDAEGALIIKLPNAMRKHIRLDVMEVLAPRHDGDRRIFPVRPRVKR